ncbi:two-component sensor histidine kinase [Brevibacillus reuszeri]|uniref:sensor histidine kinase n=1 Tax=Brevibacillus reuszeri TaxID=54915 RepID=UPI001B25A97E|nr:HAMP domain-containing sensor histidine kinase [Brevibacillus reuszeri]GIO05759.1 two-component sensor histidine kinase [Brevibacillus reuszeri]
MNIKSRLALHLIAWLVIVGLILSLLAGITLVWTMNQLTRIEATRQFESAGLYQLIQTIQAKGDSLEFDPELLALVRENGGWLQRIDEKGRVTDSFYTPEDVPLQYGPGELTAYWLGKTPFPYHMYLWIQEKNGVLHTLIYGLENRDDESIQKLINQATVKDKEIILTEEMNQQLKENNAWMQLLDEKGKELATFNKPAGAITDYSVQDLALRSVYPDRYATRLISHYDEETKLTWLLSYPMSGARPGTSPWWTPEIEVLAIGIGMLMLVAMLVFVITSYWFGQRLGAPIAHILKWLRFLRLGRYEEPTDSSGLPRSRDHKGNRRSKYRIYQDVIDSMESLSQTLHLNERLQEETERMREEWIAGVSHDLKTPLSSIKGYAHILDNKDYNWTSEEVRSFAKIILEKSSYMDDLINDLTLTYLLRNGQVAPSVERVELNEYVAEAIAEAANHPMYPEECIRFVPADCSVHLLIYKPWFQRIVDNLIANALLHNESGTTITVTVQAVKPSTIILTFADNGKGMSEETTARLFERYFRGTNTEMRTEGSGLGMAVTKALVEALGGQITVSSSLGKGTTISLIWEEAPLLKLPQPNQ